MSSIENPYAPPQVASTIVDAEIVRSVGLWRKGSVLVMHKNARLPDRCVKSNVPTQRRLKRSLYWHHPLIYLTILISILVYVILALVLRKTVTIYIGLSDEWFARRRRAILIGWTLVLAGIAMFCVGVGGTDRSSSLVWLIALAPLVFLFGAIYGLLAARMVVAQRISDDYVWLKGVHPAFLEDLPVWPYIP